MHPHWKRSAYETATHLSVGSIEEWHQAKEALELEQLQTNAEVAARSGQWQKALSLLQALAKRRVTPAAKTYNMSIVAVAQADEDGQQWESALRLLREMQGKRLRPDKAAYASVVSACCKHNELQKAVALMSEMSSQQLRPDSSSYDEVLQSCAAQGQWATALDLLKAASQQGIKSESHWVATMNACASAAQWQRALDCLRQMPIQQIKPGAESYGAAMAACDNAQQWTQALYLLSSMEASRITPDSKGYAAAASACAASGQHARELELHAKMTESQLAAVMDACVAGGGWTQAYKVLQRMLDSGQQPDPVTMAAAIKACGRAGQWSNALGLLNAMQRAGSMTSAAPHSAAAQVCAGAGKWEVVVNLLTSLECEGLRPTASMEHLGDVAKEFLAESDGEDLDTKSQSSNSASLPPWKEARRSMPFPERCARAQSCPEGDVASALAAAASGPPEALSQSRAISVVPLGGGSVVGFLQPRPKRRMSSAGPGRAVRAGTDSLAGLVTPRRRPAVETFHTASVEEHQQQSTRQALGSGNEAADDNALWRHIGRTLEAAASSQCTSRFASKQSSSKRSTQLPRLERSVAEALPPRSHHPMPRTWTYGGMKTKDATPGGNAARRGSYFGLATSETPCALEACWPNPEPGLGDMPPDVLGDFHLDEAEVKSPSVTSSCCSDIMEEPESMPNPEGLRSERRGSNADGSLQGADEDDHMRGTLRELPIRDKLRAAASTPFTNVNWKRFVRAESTCTDVKLWEFIRCVRESAMVSKEAVSDAELRLLFNHLDVDGSGSLD